MGSRFTSPMAGYASFYNAPAPNHPASSNRPGCKNMSKLLNRLSSITAWPDGLSPLDRQSRPDLYSLICPL